MTSAFLWLAVQAEYGNSITDGMAELVRSACAVCVCTYHEYNVIFCMYACYGVLLSLIILQLVVENDGDSIKTATVL